jgi:hypothetical protein
MEPSMAKTLMLSGFVSTVIALMLSGLQYKSMSPRAFAVIETTIVLIGTTTMFDGMPANAFEWSF